MPNLFVPNAERRTTYWFPFDLTIFIQGAKGLQDILEREFLLKYYANFSIMEIRNMDIRKIEWFYDRLAKEKQDERKQT